MMKLVSKGLNNKKIMHVHIYKAHVKDKESRGQEVELNFSFFAFIWNYALYSHFIPTNMTPLLPPKMRFCASIYYKALGNKDFLLIFVYMKVTT